MRIRTVSTGSQGNLYLLTNKSGHTLIIECGVHSREMLKALNYSVMEVDGCIVSHSHSDHAGHIKTYERYALPVWKAWEDDAPQSMTMGDFRITSFDLPHDGTENRGFVIRCDDETVLYMTDCEYCGYTFKSMNPTVLMVECNHQTEYLNSEEMKYEHAIRGHASVEVTKGIIEANRTETLKAVILIHASADSLNKEQAYDEISSALDSNVQLVFAEKGKEIEI